METTVEAAVVVLTLAQSTHLFPFCSYLTVDFHWLFPSLLSATFCKMGLS